MSTLHWRGKLYGLCRPEWFIFTLPLTATYVSTLSYHCLVSLVWHKSLDLELSYRLPNLQINMSLIIYCAKAWNLILRFLFLIFLFFKFVTAKELVSRFKLVRSWLLIFFFFAGTYSCGSLVKSQKICFHTVGIRLLRSAKTLITTCGGKWAVSYSVSELSNNAT